MGLKDTRAETYWKEHGGLEWKHKVDKRVHQPHYVNQLTLLSSVFKDIEVEGKRVLEVGCGFGRILNYLEDNFGVLADGLDQSESMLDTAKTCGIDSKRLVCANIRDLPKRVKRYDVIYTCEALIHVHPYHLLSVLEVMLKKTNSVVVNIETSPIKEFYSDDCHAGFWKHDYIGAYALLGKTARVVSQEGTKHSAYIVEK